MTTGSTRRGQALAAAGVQQRAVPWHPSISTGTSPRGDPAPSRPGHASARRSDILTYLGATAGPALSSRLRTDRFVLGVGVTYGDMAPQHPLIETGARRQGLTGNREQAVVASIRAAEVRVRSLAGPGNDATGAGLMTKAFGPSGRRTGPRR